MGKSGQGEEGVYDVGSVTEEVVGYVQFGKFLEGRHIGGQDGQSVAVEGEAFQVLEFGEDGHH